MSYMIAAYAVFWILTFVFVYSIFSRQRSLRRELEVMEQLLESQNKDQG